MDDFVDLFKSTLQSLVADAACIREITSLAELIGVETTTSTTTSTMPFLISTSSSSLRRPPYTMKSDPGTNTQQQQQEQQQQEQLQKHYRQELVDLDKMIANMEQKVITLREIIKEENQALSKFETVLQEEADEQDMFLQELMSLIIVNDGGKEEGNGQEDFSEDENENNSRSLPQSPGRTNTQTCYRRSSDITFELVTEAEILEQKRNIPFGKRVSRYDLNDAMQEIQKVVQRKAALEEKTSHHPLVGENIRLSSNSLQRRFDYLRQRQRGSNGADASIETDAHVGYWWVTEQELRENCSFFRQGESSARRILSLLCSLRRLKQVPGKNMDITYLWI
jgi:hypothetical protein